MCIYGDGNANLPRDRERERERERQIEEKRENERERERARDLVVSRMPPTCDRWLVMFWMSSSVHFQCWIVCWFVGLGEQVSKSTSK